MEIKNGGTNTRAPKKPQKNPNPFRDRKKCQDALSQNDGRDPKRMLNKRGTHGRFHFKERGGHYPAEWARTKKIEEKKILQVEI